MKYVDAIEARVKAEFHGGSRVTNCVLHMDLPFNKRPENCRLCYTDVVNHMMYAIRVNEWLNDWREKTRTDIEVLLRVVGQMEEALTEILAMPIVAEENDYPYQKGRAALAVLDCTEGETR